EVMSLLEKEKANLKTIESLKSKRFESSENVISESENQIKNDCQVVEKECDQEENSKVIAPGMFKLSVSQSVSPISMLKTSCDSNNVKNLDTFSSVRSPKHSGVIWKKKGSSNTSNVDLSSVSLSKLNKNVKRYSRKDLLSYFPDLSLDHRFGMFKAYDGKIHGKHHKSKTAFASNKPLYLLHMDLCGPMRIESVNRKRYVLVVVDDYSRLEPDLSNLNKTGKSLNPLVSQVSETSKKDLEDLFHNFYDEYFDSPKIMKSSTTNVETSNVEVPSNQEEAFHESFESFQEESSSSSLNDNVRQSLEEFGVPSSNTQQISNNLIPNVDEESTSHNVFNERLEDAYFDASTSFHDLSSVYTFYQPYPHEKKWTKDHPLHKIIGDP
nr:putative integrase [Tanacetum cinerariifolium]